MIIDLILDRKDDEKLLQDGYTEKIYPNGDTVKIEYNAHDFYIGVLTYGGYYSEQITRAMDYGTEAQVKNALCEYVIENEYNPQICDYINNRKWIA